MHILFRRLAALLPLAVLIGVSGCRSNLEAPADAISDSRVENLGADCIAPQLERLRGLLGEWELTQVLIEDDGSSSSTPRGPSQTQITLNRFLLETRLRCDVAGVVTHCLLTWSFDPFMEVYRVTITEGAFGYMDLHEGVFEENGTLLLSNEGMPTPLSSSDGTLVGRYRLEFEDGDDASGYTLFGNFSVDGGETWPNEFEMRFRPAASAQG
jgi:hypothetical protein